MYTEGVHPLFYITLHEHIYRFECSQSYQTLTYVRHELSCVSLGIVPVTRSSKVLTQDFSCVLIFETRKMFISEQKREAIRLQNIKNITCFTQEREKFYALFSSVNTSRMAQLRANLLC
jgi:hypothetical protein